MSNNNHQISIISRVAMILCGLLILCSEYLPIWRIDLDAPQYPEGLNLLIFANRLGGNVDIINGLNHYIGMKELYTGDFMEFAILPYLIAFFALFAIGVAVLSSRRLLAVFIVSLIVFGVVSMVDFYRWNYDYGHDLDPNAAIIVPGMAYQPPLIGYKQLLNFGAYSIPDSGGWLFISAGVLALLVLLYERGVFRRWKVKGAGLVSLALGISALSSCGPSGPQPVRINIDQCDFCKMTIADGRFAAEMITEKGRVYKFDDISCLVQYQGENPEMIPRESYVADYLTTDSLIPVERAFFIKGEEVASPMAGNMAAFSSEASALEYASRLSADRLSWEEIKP